MTAHIAATTFPTLSSIVPPGLVVSADSRTFMRFRDQTSPEGEVMPLLRCEEQSTRSSLQKNGQASDRALLIARDRGDETPNPTNQNGQ